MNRHVPALSAEKALSPALRPSTEWAKNAEAFFHLALSQRRRAHGYRRMALEEEGNGHLAAYRHFKALATYQWKQAKAHLSQARHHHELDLRSRYVR